MPTPHEPDTTNTDTPVLVIGAGPVGLTLSLLLSQRGIDHLVVEKHPSLSQHPKARGVSSSSMETFRRLGMEHQIREASLPPEHVAFFRGATLSDPHAVRTQPSEPAELGTPSPGVICSQDVLETLLLAEARARHPRGEAGIRFGTRLTALAPHPEGPRARLQRSDGGEETVVARTVVGCDGADSTVRHLAGLGLEGERGLAHFRSVRFDAPLGEHVRGRESASYFLTGPGGGGFLAIDNDHDWILQIRLDGSEGPEPASPEARIEDDARLAERISRDAGVPDLAVRVHLTMAWRMDAALAEAFSGDQIALAGDAAHQIPPTGGHGMNLGIADAEALAWRLPGDRARLMSYAAERKRVARAVLDLSLDNARRAYALDGNLLTRVELTGDTVLRDAEQAVTLHAGARLPHAWLADGTTSTLDLFGPGWALLAETGDAPGAAALRAAHPEAEVWPISGAMRGFGMTPSGAVLVRPDGVVAEVRTG